MNERGLPLRTYLQRLVWVCLLPSALVIVLLAAFAVHRLHAERTECLRELG